MEEPNISEIEQRLKEFSQSLRDNHQIGNSKIILAMADLISVMGWAGFQQDKYSKKLVGLTWAIVVLTVLMLIGLIIQIILVFR